MDKTIPRIITLPLQKYRIELRPIRADILGKLVDNISIRILFIENHKQRD